MIGIAQCRFINIIAPERSMRTKSLLANQLNHAKQNGWQLIAFRCLSKAEGFANGLIFAWNEPKFHWCFQPMIWLIVI